MRHRHICGPHPIGVEHHEIYDGVLYWQCAVCERTWHRWEPGTWQRAAAERFITPTLPPEPPR